MDIKGRICARKRDHFPSFPNVRGAWDIWDIEDGCWLNEGIRGPFFSKKACDKAIAHLVTDYQNMSVHVN